MRGIRGARGTQETRETRIAPISAAESDELAGHTGVGGGGQSLQASGGFRVEGLLVETVIGSQFDLGFVIISALLQGVFAEIPFALTRYRMFNLPISIASGALVALEYGTYLMLFRYVGVSFVSPRGIVHMISEVTGGVLISGVMAWYLMLAIAKTGVLDRLASGRALIERRA